MLTRHVSSSVLLSLRERIFTVHFSFFPAESSEDPLAEREEYTGAGASG